MFANVQIKMFLTIRQQNATRSWPLTPQNRDDRMLLLTSSETPSNKHLDLFHLLIPVWRVVMALWQG